MPPSGAKTTGSTSLRSSVLIAGGFASSFVPFFSPLFSSNKFAVDCSSRVEQGKSTLATTWIVTPHAWYDLAMKEAVTLDATVALAGGSAGVTVSTPKFLEL